MTGQTCALLSCFKPPWPSGDSPAFACGSLHHHQLLMASRFNRALPQPPHQTILDRTAAGLCALLSCEEAPQSGDFWCSRSHYLSWLSEFTSSLKPDQICMFLGCTRHVYVDDNGHPSKFCGWRHEQKFVMLSARQHCQQGNMVSPQAPPSSTASVNESELGSMPSFNSLMQQFDIAPKDIRVIEDFFEKHPWEVLTEGQDCWIIACPKFTLKNSRQLTTKGYRWRQSGRKVKKKGYSVTYYKYIKTKGKEMFPDQQHAESSYTMQEYTLEGTETTYTLIHLVKEKHVPKGRLGKGQSHSHPIADQVDKIVCVEDRETFSPSDYDPVDTFLNDLPYLDDDGSEFAQLSERCRSVQPAFE